MKISINEQIAVMQAFEAGKTVEQRPISERSDWRIVRQPSWNWDKNLYRIAPKVKNSKSYDDVFEDGYFIATVVKNKHGSVIVSKSLYEQLRYGELMVIKIPNSLVGTRTMDEKEIEINDMPFYKRAEHFNKSRGD